MKPTSLLVAATLLLSATGASAQSSAQPTATTPSQSCARYYTRGTTGGGSITYVEVVPSQDAKHEQFAQLRRAFVAIKPTVVFFENPDCGVDTTEITTINRLGVAGYTRFLAQQYQVAAERLDDPVAEYDYLKTKVDVEQLKLYYLLHHTQQFRQRTGASKALTMKAMQAFIANSASFLPGTEHVIRNMAELKTAYQKYCPTSGKWQQAPATWFGATAAPASAGSSPLADLNRLVCAFRSEYMYRKLVEKAQAGHHVLVVVGHDHVPASPVVASLTTH